MFNMLQTFVVTMVQTIVVNMRPVVGSGVKAFVSRAYNLLKLCGGDALSFMTLRDKKQNIHG